MIKMIGIFNRKPGLTDEQFKEYYEGNHAPLIASVMPQICDYRRSYVVKDDRYSPGHLASVPRPSFDVITECWFKDRAAFDAMTEVTRDVALGNRIQEDEARFLDRERMMMFLVEEHISRRSGGR